jgi:hypothetical protein
MMTFTQKGNTFEFAFMEIDLQKSVGTSTVEKTGYLIGKAVRGWVQTKEPPTLHA